MAALGVQADEHVEQRLHAQGALVAPRPVQEQLLQLLEPHLGRHGAARPAPNAPDSRRPLSQSVRASPRGPGGREPRQLRRLVAAPSASSRPGLGRHLGLGPGGAASGAPGPAGPWAGLLPSAPPPAPPGAARPRLASPRPAARPSAPPAAAPSPPSPPAADPERRGPSAAKARPAPEPRPQPRPGGPAPRPAANQGAASAGAANHRGAGRRRADLSAPPRPCAPGSRLPAGWDLAACRRESGMLGRPGGGGGASARPVRRRDCAPARAQRAPGRRAQRFADRARGCGARREPGACGEAGGGCFGGVTCWFKTVARRSWEQPWKAGPCRACTGARGPDWPQQLQSGDPRGYPAPREFGVPRSGYFRLAVQLSSTASKCFRVGVWWTAAGCLQAGFAERVAASVRLLVYLGGGVRRVREDTPTRTDPWRQDSGAAWSSRDVTEATGWLRAGRKGARPWEA